MMDCKQIPLFSSISEDNCLAMMQCFKAKECFYKSGQTAYTYSDGDDSVGIIVEGEAFIERIDVNGYRTILERLPKNSVFGRMLAFSAGGDFVSVVCKKPCRIVYIDYKHLTGRCSNACEHHSVLVRNMFQIIAKKAEGLADRIEVISHRSLRDKLVCCFRQLSAGKDSAEMPFSLSQLADYICADRSAMMRELKHMKDEGLVSINKRTVKLNKNLLN